MKACVWDFTVVGDRLYVKHRPFDILLDDDPSLLNDPFYTTVTVQCTNSHRTPDGDGEMPHAALALMIRLYNCLQWQWPFRYH